MAEVVRRRYSRILREAAAANPDAEYNQESPADAARRSPAATGLPDLVIVDGGKGQLSSACKELAHLGLGEMSIVGLAKEFEEIYRPGDPDPLRLDKDSGALKLLQRIRDEAHRFANGYHSLLLKKRMKESVLDDIPGMTEARKRALLGEFGSVERLRKLGPETLAGVQGVSPRLAEEVSEYLNRVFPQRTSQSS